MSIQEHLNKIRNAVYGHEVRESIAKGIETAYDDASENGNANMEVTFARGTHPNLRSRLEEVDNKQQQNTAQLQQTEQSINAQLAEKANQEFVNQQIANVASGTPKGAFETLQELQNSYPTGATGIYVISADGNWYYWNGSSWESGGVYQSTLWQNALTTQNTEWGV